MASYTYAGASGAGLQVVFRAIGPKRFSFAEMQYEMLEEVNKIAQEALTQFIRTTDGWNHSVLFRVLGRVSPKTRNSTIKITTDSEIYGFVDGGVEAHYIEPRDPVSKKNPAYASALSTREFYTAKTTPGSMQSSSGGHGGRTIYKPAVWHPGYPGRGFTEKVADWTVDQMDRRLPLAIQRGLDKGIVQ